MELFEKQNFAFDTEIPKRFMRVWIGNKQIPDVFEGWWIKFKEIHPDYEFITLDDTNIKDLIDIPTSLLHLIDSVKTCAGVSDIIRILSLHQIGGIYVDTDVMPLKSFDNLLATSNKPFLAKRSSKSFESAVIGSPKGHPAFSKLIRLMPEWAEIHKDRAASVQTGPAYISHILFGREDINHLSMKTFYPYNGFKAPKKEEKLKIFSDINNFPEEMLAAHYSNHIWGGKHNFKYEE